MIFFSDAHLILLQIDKTYYSWHTLRSMMKKLPNISIQQVYSEVFVFLDFICMYIDELNKKIKTLADFIRNSKHFVVYTGAGKYFVEKKICIRK